MNEALVEVEMQNVQLKTDLLMAQNQAQTDNVMHKLELEGVISANRINLIKFQKKIQFL